MIDISEFVAAIEKTVHKHNLGNPGEYKRWLWQDKQNSRDLAVNEYGCADAANILYTIGSFPNETQEREGFIHALRSLQDPRTGLFTEESHHELHTTAHCVAALELFDAKPEHALHALSYLEIEKELKSFLEDLDWRGDPWHESHKGAGLYTVLVLNEDVTNEWQEWYFNWFWREADPDTGFWRKNCILQKGCASGPASAPLFHHLAGTFHYLFVHEYAHRPLRYPARLVDSCLKIYKENLFPTPHYLYDDQYIKKAQKTAAGDQKSSISLGQSIGFAEIDWTYCLNRALRQSGHRYNECEDTLKEFAERYLNFLTNEVDVDQDDRFNDLHWLFGMTCAIAELQQALPGFIKTEKPLRLVLDRRPFI